MDAGAQFLADGVPISPPRTDSSKGCLCVLQGKSVKDPKALHCCGHGKVIKNSNQKGQESLFSY